MGEWVQQILSSNWFPVLLAYVLGNLTGWLIFRAQGADAAEGADSSDNETASPNLGSGSASRKLSALEDEIKKAKDLLEADAKENDQFSEIIEGLDDAINRANGRLKLVMKSVKRIKSSD